MRLQFVHEATIGTVPTHRTMVRVGSPAMGRQLCHQHIRLANGEGPVRPTEKTLRPRPEQCGKCLCVSLLFYSHPIQKASAHMFFRKRRAITTVTITSTMTNSATSIRRTVYANKNGDRLTPRLYPSPELATQRRSRRLEARSPLVAAFAPCVSCLRCFIGREGKP